MLIQCPFCHAPSTLPARQEGAKVRCGACGKVYRARPRGAGKLGSSSNVAIWRLLIIASAVVVLAVVLVVVNHSNEMAESAIASADAPLDEPPPAEEETVSDWESPPVQAVREAYQAVRDGDEERLAARLDPARLHAWRSGPDAPDFAQLSPEQAAAFRDSLIDELTDPATFSGPAAWNPFDGEIASEDGQHAIVRMKLGGLDPATALETREVLWELWRDGPDPSPWKIGAWEAVPTKGSVEAERGAATRMVEVELLDGSKVKVPERLTFEHLSATPEELRPRIEALCRTLVDLGLGPKDNAAAKAELVRIGPPALPILFRTLSEIELVGRDEAIQINLIDQCLNEITGHSTGYRPQVRLGVEPGSADDHRQRAIRAWFSWWERDGPEFLAAWEREKAAAAASAQEP